MGSNSSKKKEDTNEQNIINENIINDYLTSLDLNNVEKEKMPVLNFQLGGNENSYDKYNISKMISNYENTAMEGGDFNKSSDFNTSSDDNKYLSSNVMNTLNNITQKGGDYEETKNIIDGELKEIINGGGCKCNRNNGKCNCDNLYSKTSSDDYSPTNLNGGQIILSSTSTTFSKTTEDIEDEELDENTTTTTSTVSSSKSSSLIGGSQSDYSSNNVSNINKGISIFPFESSEDGNSLSERNMRLLRKHL